MQQQQRRGGLRLTLLFCLLALAHNAAGQGLLDMFQNGAGATPTTPTTDPTATPTTEGQVPVTDPTATPTTEGQVPVTDPTATPTTEGQVPVTDPTATPTTEGQVPVTDPATTPVTDAATTPVTDPATTPVTDPATTPVTGPTTAPAAGTTTPPAAGTNTTTTAPTTNIPAPAAPLPNTTGTGAGTTTNTAPVPLNAGAVTNGTPPVAAAPGSDTAAVLQVGTVSTEQQTVEEDKLPPAPPADWATMQKDCQLVFSVEIRGRYIVPFTSPKAQVIARVLRDRYLRSATLPEISVSAVNSFTYISNDDDQQTNNTDLLAAGDAAAAASGALGTVGGRRRLAGGSRALLQTEKSGAELRIVVATASVRTDSEIATFNEGVDSGSMARDFTLAGIETDNLTLLIPAYQEDLIGPGNVEDKPTDTVESWVIGVIVGCILLILPIPLFFLIRWRKRKNREGREIAAAEAEALRQRTQSKFMRPGSKSFTLRSGPSADIMVRSGSIGGLSGYHNNGRLQSWTGSPERQYGQQYNNNVYAHGVSRQTSVTSMGSALPSARGASYTQPVGQVRNPMMGPMNMPPPGAYEEEVHTARSHRSARSYNGGQ
ncbi:hypothetical protein D9Q98_002798 [Chlorella vulgaris]|uniref:Uncharacterized protein n=1 Tax=Chlorella vulgaris TaxID=3077 RepID=A0A9D4YZG5_CHLVU|nr:hypothetical protein D9Q98_002798 [Chlorella vulgaris]